MFIFQLEGVNIISNSNVQKAEITDDNRVLISTENCKITADHVVVAIGLQPNIELGVSSDLEVDQNLGGFVVNAELQARDSIWVAGDAACFYDIRLGRRRVEHHDHAVVTGRLAGENMSSTSIKPYTHQSMFWSGKLYFFFIFFFFATYSFNRYLRLIDLGSKIGFEAIGIIDSSLKTLGGFAQPNEVDSDKTEVKHLNY